MDEKVLQIQVGPITQLWIKDIDFSEAISNYLQDEKLYIQENIDRLNIFVIYNGNHFGRFIPYPREITQNYHPIYHPEIGINLDDYKKQSNYPGFKSNLYIDDISFNMVKDKIDSILGSKYAKHII